MSEKVRDRYNNLPEEKQTTLVYEKILFSTEKVTIRSF